MSRFAKIKDASFGGPLSGGDDAYVPLDYLGRSSIHTLTADHVDYSGNDGSHAHDCGCAACSEANDASEAEVKSLADLSGPERMELEEPVVPVVSFPMQLGDGFLANIVQSIIDALQNRDIFVSGTGENGIFSDFNIEIVFLGNNWTEDLREEFVKAAEYLSSVITGDLEDVTQRNIDDVRIRAELSDIDGEGGILGQAGPLAIRSGGLTTLGTMEFDVADAAALDAEDLFDDTALHEMMHVLGFGTLWGPQNQDLTEGTVGRDNIRYVGENGVAAYEALFPEIADDFPDGVPIETDGGPGTAGGHWDDGRFGNELMTGFISDPNYISPMTIAVFEDLGYETVFDISDPSAPVLQPDELVFV